MELNEIVAQRRFDVTLTLDGSTETVHTFTWGVDYQAAYNRIAQGLEDSFWDGWSFEISKTPSA